MAGSKVPVGTVSNLQNNPSSIQVINQNDDDLSDMIERTLSRFGETDANGDPIDNAMGTDLDMDLNRVRNLPAPANADEPARHGDIQQYVDAAEAAQEAAEVAQAAAEDALADTVAEHADALADIASDLATAQTTIANDLLSAQTDITEDRDAALADIQEAYEVLAGLYCGISASDPTVDLNGDAVTNGDFYFNSSGNIIKFYKDGSWYDFPSGALAGLSDVDLTTPVTNDVLVFDGNKWVNDASPPVNGALDDLDDVVISALAIGQFLQTADGANFKNLSLFKAIHIYGTSDTSHTWASDASQAIVICQAAGGGGGALGNTSGAGSGGSATAGETRLGIVTRGGSSTTIAIGAKGTGGAAGNNAGNDGGDTSFGSDIVAKGGKGGSGSAGNANASAGATPSGGSGGILIPATRTPSNFADSTAVNLVGGACLFSAPASVISASAFAVYNGLVASGKGGGGTGGACRSGTTTAAGGDGSDGLMIVLEF